MWALFMHHYIQEKQLRKVNIKLAEENVRLTKELLYLKQFYEVPDNVDVSVDVYVDVTEPILTQKKNPMYNRQ